MLIKNDRRGADDYAKVATAVSTPNDHISKLVVSGMELGAAVTTNVAAATAEAATGVVARQRQRLRRCGGALGVPPLLRRAPAPLMLQRGRSELGLDAAILRSELSDCRRPGLMTQLMLHH